EVAAFQRLDFGASRGDRSGQRPAGQTAAAIRDLAIQLVAVEQVIPKSRPFSGWISALREEIVPVSVPQGKQPPRFVT
ncbi:hypothetical protein CQA86_32435, partial [Klebsiella pneumoniae]